MTKTELGTTVLKASTGVLETMFFASSEVCADPARQHADAVACMVLFSGAEEGVLTVAVDRAALKVLCESFYGSDDPGSIVKEREVLCELCNMLAGSALSVYTPEQYCSLASPLLCNLERHQQTLLARNPNDMCSSTRLDIDGGLLSICCRVRVDA